MKKRIVELFQKEMWLLDDRQKHGFESINDDIARTFRKFCSIIKNNKN